MPLEAGARLGPYEIVSLLGSGGMGEVYKARDTRLDRIVAIKMLSAALVGDAESHERFEREARTISQLTHPNICVLHDIGRYEETDYLVIEFLDGESLAARIQNRPLKLDEALRIAIQIAHALHAAHRAGIVHRDLKPGNVMLTKSGAGSAGAPQAKLLDFGLAKHGAGWAGRAGAAGRESVSGVAQGFSPAELTASPTLTNPLTMRGAIVGTLQYMAPEQLEGTDADARSDLFAFGAVLYEMVSGNKAFTGKSQVSVMAAILDHDPPSLVSAAPSTPPALDRLIRKCLSKDPEARWQNAGDVASELEWIAESAQQVPADAGAGTAATKSAEMLALQRIAARRFRGWMIAALVFPVAAAGVVWALMRAPAAEPPQRMRFAIVPPATQPLAMNGADREIAISADGTKIVYVASVGGQRQLMLRAIDQLEAAPLRGVSNPRVPFFSPDGQWIGYFEGGAELKKVSVTGGPPISLCKISPPPRGATWGADNTIIFATGDTSTGLLAVPAGGGDPKVLTKPDRARGETDHMFPSLLPGGGAVLFTITGRSLETFQVAALDLKSGQQKTLIRGGTHAEYVESGHLVYAASGALRAVRFDPLKLDVLSDPVPVVEQVTTAGTGVAEFSVSRTGVLLFVPGGSSAGGVARTLTWIGRNGHEEPIKSPPRAYTAARLSLDDTRIALSIADQELDVWILDVSRDPPPLTRLTFDPAQEGPAIWTPDGKRVVFRSSRNGPGNLFWRSADGTGAEERLTTSSNNQVPLVFSSDGSRLVFMESMPATGPDLFTMPADGKGKSEPLVQTSFAEVNADLSPDGRWMVFESTESGRSEVYVRPFPNAGGGKWMVSTTGGGRPVWARTGNEIVYLDANANALMSVPVRTTPTFNAGTPAKALDASFYTTAPGRTYDISRDGQKFLIIKNPQVDQTANATAASMVVVLNWPEELKARLPPSPGGR